MATQPAEAAVPRWRVAFLVLVGVAVVTNVIVLVTVIGALEPAGELGSVRSRLGWLAVADLGFGVAVALAGAALARGTVQLLGARQARRLQVLVDGGPDLLGVIGDDDRFTFAAGLLAHRGHGPSGIGAVKGVRLDELVVPEDVERVREVLADVRAGGGGHRGELAFAFVTEDGLRHVQGAATNHVDDAAVNGLVVSLHDVTDQRNLEAELARQAFQDSLTGLANRALFRDRVDGAVARLVRARRAPTLLFVDLDDFKAVNDTYGHAVGDALLVSVADDLRAVVREGDTAARLGGDEFAILLEDTADEEVARLVARRLHERLGRPRAIMGLTLRAPGSIGIAPGEVGWSTEMLLRNADIAMYEAKRGHGDGIAAFEPTMYEDLQRRARLRDDFDRALSAGVVESAESRVLGTDAHRSG